MTRTIIIVALLLACVAGAAGAGTIQARSDQPASVFLDGQYVGRTPVDIPFVRGRHELRFRSRATGQELSYGVRGGGRRHLTRIDARFGYAYTPRVFAPRVFAPRVYGAPYRYHDRYDRYDRHDYRPYYRRW